MCSTTNFTSYLNKKKKIQLFFIFQEPAADILVQPVLLNERDELLQNENDRNSDGDENMVENKQIQVPVVEMNLVTVS